jgi:plasmid stabilization system protein ParE
MVKRNIVWTRTADLQFIGILEYWVEKNKSNVFSKKLLKLVIKRTLEISENPFIYKSTDFKDVRVSSLKNFSIYYKVTDEQIIVSAFWDNRQNPKKLLRILQNEK